MTPVFSLSISRPAEPSAPLRRPHQHRLGAPEGGEEAFQRVHLRQVVEHDVGMGGVTRHEVLVLVLGRIEGAVGLDLRDDRGREGARLVELGDVGLGDPRLFGARREDRRAIVRADVRALAVELGRVVDDREEDLQQAPVADDAGIEGDADRLCVSVMPLLTAS